MAIALVACIKERITNRPSCGGRGSIAIIDKIETEIKNRELPIPVERISCLGECSKGPNMRIAPGGKFFYGTTEDKIPEIIDELAAEFMKNQQ
ncbi:MAG: (2Fe-2S) ferredoxin domain-containing protein [Magnetococcales bacterium]|nr:(2Fe-2S) ferredoxin domain-containing protein [Magnetococcales bacterium]